MKKTFSITIIIILLLNGFVIAQKKQNAPNPFQRVKIPDSIFLQLEKKYKEIAGHDSVNAGRNVWNLLEPKNLTLKNSVYSFAGQGPHFPRLIFIYYNQNAYVINAIGAFDPLAVINEYVKYVNELKFSDSEIRKYLKAVSLYLSQEEGQTYGSEFKKAN